MELVLELRPAADRDRVVAVLLNKVVIGQREAGVRFEGLVRPAVEHPARLGGDALHLGGHLRGGVGDRAVAHLGILVQPVDADAVEAADERALVVVEVVEAGGDAADQRDLGGLEVLDRAQRAHGDREAAAEERVLHVPEEPFDRDVVILEVVADDAGIHVDGAEGVEGQHPMVGMLGDRPQAERRPGAGEDRGERAAEKLVHCSRMKSTPSPSRAFTAA